MLASITHYARCSWHTTDRRSALLCTCVLYITVCEHANVSNANGISMFLPYCIEIAQFALISSIRVRGAA